jgi:hypothetical protein
MTERVRADRYLRRTQLALAVFVGALILCIALSGLGTLATTRTFATIVSASPSGAEIRLDYTSFNPGPVFLKEVGISVVVLDPNGTPLTYPDVQKLSIPPLSASSGTLTFNLTLLPGAAVDVEQMNRLGQAPLIYMNVSTGFWSLMTTTVTISSNGTASGGGA